MKDFWSEMKENIREMRVELILMVLFVGIFFYLKGPDLEKKWNHLYPKEKAVIEEVETEQMTENATCEEPTSEEESETETIAEKGTETETETELQTEAETEVDLTAQREQIRKLYEIRFGRAFEVPHAVVRDHRPDGQIFVYTLDQWKLPIAYRMFWKTETEPDRSMELLQKQLETKIAEYDGNWSIYVKRLDTEETALINDEPMKSASVMKLFIMGTVYQAIDAGELEKTDEIQSLMQNMIEASDNESSNSLLYKLGGSSYEAGIAKVDKFIEENGFSDMTFEYNGFNNSATVMDSSSFNQVAAKDCGRLLETIYRRTLVNREVSNQIETMMLNQHTRYKIPKGLPEGVLCGNKTGEMDQTENDAAIIYSPNCDYILVVLSNGWSNKDTAINRIAEISRVTYEFFN